MDFVGIDPSALPPEEHEAAQSIGHALLALQSNAEEFRQTVGLYLFAHARKLLVQNTDRGQMFEMIGLVKIAGRNGAVVASSFARLMEAINSTKAPTIWAKADMAERRKASKLFAKEFPEIEAIRRSAAHPGELMKSFAEQSKHRLRKRLIHPAVQAHGPTYIESLMHAERDLLRFGATIEGEFVEYELSLAKADILDAAANLYCRTFYPLEAEGQQGAAKWIRENEARHLQDQRSRPQWWHSLLRP